MNDPCNHCGMIDFDSSCGFCDLHKKHYKTQQQLKEANEIILNLEGSKGWWHKVFKYNEKYGEVDE